jgi:CRP-like cAMP-binding protein
LVAPNHFGDLQQLAGGRAHVQSVEVIADAILALVPFRVLDGVLQQNSALCRAWLGGLASQFISTIDSDRHNAFVPLSGRVANVLLSYAEVFGSPARAGIEVTVPLTRAQIARHVGTVKRCVARVLKSFEERGVIDGHERHLILRAPEALRRETLPMRLGLAHRMPGD